MDGWLVKEDLADEKARREGRRRGGPMGLCMLEGRSFLIEELPIMTLR